jgi:diguanylate cyclase (GGDEF)-like protein
VTALVIDIAVDRSGFSFDPVVNIHSGHALGFILTAATLGKTFDGIADFANAASLIKSKLFIAIPDPERDAHVALATMPRALSQAARAAGLGLERIRVIVSSRSALWTEGERSVFDAFAEYGVGVAIGDFGGGRLGLQALSARGFDNAFIAGDLTEGIAQDKQRQSVALTVLTAAHAFGAMATACGVANEQDFLAARSLGFDFVSGPLISTRETSASRLVEEFHVVLAMGGRDRRGRLNDRQRVYEFGEMIQPVYVDTSMVEVIARFRAHKTAPLIPVLDYDRRPRGVVLEASVKEYLYSPFGHGLLANKTIGGRADHFLSPCPTVDRNTGVARIVQSFSENDGSVGLLLTEDERYIGFLSAQSLLRIVNESNLSAARDQNPLTKLPGNTRIFEYVSDALAQTEIAYVLTYFDFDYFKPLNDTYGFRVGDRAILMFAELLTMAIPSSAGFVGHIGGDDFFVALADADWRVAAPVLADLIETFRVNCVSLYDADARQSGYIDAHDRDGNPKRFPLLTVSGVALELSPGRPVANFDDVVAEIAAAKGLAKSSPDHLHHISLGPAGIEH